MVMAKIHAAVRMISIGEDPFSPHLSKVDFVVAAWSWPNRAQKFMASLAREVMSLRTRLEVLNIRSASERILRGFPEDRRAGPARSDAARSSPDHDLQQENRRSYGHGGWHQRKSCGRVYSDLIGTL